jgi:hypothetical protein
VTNLIIPNAFTSGSTIIAADMNQNFDAVKAFLNTTGVPKIQDSAIGSAALENSAVTTTKINDDAVTSAKLASASVATGKIVDAAVTTAKLADANVTTAKLADDAVATAKITDASVTAAKLAGASVTVGKLAALQSFAASGTITTTGSSKVVFTGSTVSQTLTLPAAASGLEYHIHNAASVPVTIGRDGADLIGTEASIILAPGTHVLLIGTSGAWYPQWTPGMQVSGGYSSSASDSSGAGDKAQLDLVGDGVTPIMLRATAWVETGGGAGSTVFLRVRTEANGGGSVVRGSRHIQYTANAGAFLRPEVVVAPFSGAKSYYLHLSASSGTPTTGGSSVGLTDFRAVWAPGAYTANP